jgi:hypothetical protein
MRVQEKDSMGKREINYILTKILSAFEDLSVLQISAGKPFQTERDGQIFNINISSSNFKVLSPFQVEMFALNIINQDRQLIGKLLMEGQCELVYETGGGKQFNVTIFFEQNKYHIVFKTIQAETSLYVYKYGNPLECELEIDQPENSDPDMDDVIGLLSLESELDSKEPPAKKRSRKKPMEPALDLDFSSETWQGILEQKNQGLTLGNKQLLETGMEFEDLVIDMNVVSPFKGLFDEEAETEAQDSESMPIFLDNFVEEVTPETVGHGSEDFDGEPEPLFLDDLLGEDDYPIEPVSYIPEKPDKLDPGLSPVSLHDLLGEASVVSETGEIIESDEDPIFLDIGSLLDDEPETKVSNPVDKFADANLEEDFIVIEDLLDDEDMEVPKIVTHETEEHIEFDAELEPIALDDLLGDEPADAGNTTEKLEGIAPLVYEETIDADAFPEDEHNIETIVISEESDELGTEPSPILSTEKIQTIDPFDISEKSGEYAKGSGSELPRVDLPEEIQNIETFVVSEEGLQSREDSQFEPSLIPSPEEIQNIETFVVSEEGDLFKENSEDQAPEHSENIQTIASSDEPVEYDGGTDAESPLVLEKIEDIPAGASPETIGFDTVETDADSVSEELHEILKGEIQHLETTGAEVMKSDTDSPEPRKHPLPFRKSPNVIMAFEPENGIAEDVVSESESEFARREEIEAATAESDDIFDEYFYLIDDMTHDAKEPSGVSIQGMSEGVALKLGLSILLVLIVLMILYGIAANF